MVFDEDSTVHSSAVQCAVRCVFVFVVELNKSEVCLSYIRAVTMEHHRAALNQIINQITFGLVVYSSI